MGVKELTTIKYMYHLQHQIIHVPVHVKILNCRRCQESNSDPSLELVVKILKKTIVTHKIKAYM